MGNADSKQKIHLLKYLIISTLIIFIIGALFFDFVFANPQKHAKKKLSYASSKPKITAIPLSPTLIPTSTPTPIPTQAYSGFCLNIPILMYHHIQPEALAKTKNQTSLTVDNDFFDQQMSYITTHGYTIVSASQLVDALRFHTPLARKSIVVTIDDGYKDAYEYAFPILKKYNIPASLMIPTGLLEGDDYLSWSQLGEMVNSGIINLTDHTWSHYNVARGTADKIKYEIETGKAQLEQHTGVKITLFTYPNGSFGNEAIKVLQEDGFTGAFTTIPGTYQCDSFILTLHRTRIGNAPLSAYGL